MRRLVLTATALLLTIALGCNRRPRDTGGVSDTTMTPAATPAPEVTDTAPTVRDFSFDQRQEFGQSIRQQLAQVDQQIADLRSQAKSRGGAVSDRALANIAAARRTVERNLTRVNTATVANWDQIKNRVNQSVESLNESIEAAQPK